MLEIDQGILSSYISGKNKFTKKFALRLQDVAVINSDYLLNGNMPMMVDETRKPILDDNTPYTSKTKEEVIKGGLLENMKMLDTQKNRQNFLGSTVTNIPLPYVIIIDKKSWIKIIRIFNNLSFF